MTVVSALERELALTEHELHALLVRVLPGCIENGAMVFFNSENLPVDYQHHWLPKEADELFELARRCSSIRSELGLPVAQTLAQLFLDAWARARILKTNTVADLANWQPGCSRRSNRVLIRPLELLSNVGKKPLAIRLRAGPQNALRVHSCG